MIKKIRSYIYWKLVKYGGAVVIRSYAIQDRLFTTFHAPKDHGFSDGEAGAKQLNSCECTQEQLQSPTFQSWAIRMGEPPMQMHRKTWEWRYITQALYERGMLATGKRGLGFAVGQEPLSALFASLGCNIVATDLATEDAKKNAWVQTNQHADSLKILNKRGICSDDVLRDKVTFQFLDMRDLPDDLGKFDFIWSSCSLEHLGSMAQGERFIYESLKYLKPGGVAVHTTEYNVSTNLITFKKASVIPFRKRDLQRIAMNLRLRGYKTDFDFSHGNLPYDHLVAKPPFGNTVHLKLLLFPFVITSFGIIIKAG